MIASMSLVTALVIPVVVTYAMFKGVNLMFEEMAEKEKPITVIKFKDWSVDK